MNILSDIPPSEQRREASTWQGGARPRYPEASVEHAHVDLALNAALGRLTGYVSPAALAGAWHDWATHLLLSPAKQLELGVQAMNNMQRWLQYSTSAMFGTPAEPVQPLAQDKRFNDPLWHAWPWNQLSQGFLLTQQWWHRATTDVRGVSSHHGDVVTFIARQLLDGVAPSNFIATNPVVQQVTLASGGQNLLHGMARAGTDMRRALAGTSAPASLRPGRDVAITPGKVVMENHLVELLRYDPVTPQVHAVPLLIVPAWIMKYYILDLSPHNSLVRYLVEHGHTVYMISWKNPQADDRDLSLDDYRRHGIMESLDMVVRESGAPQINACGYCLGGTLLAIAAAAMARDGDERLASMTLLAAQVDFTEPGELSLFIDESQVSFLEAVMWQQGYLDTRQMAGAFQLLRSNDLIWSRRLRHYLLDIPDKDNDLASWNADATRMPYRMHSQYLRNLFLQNSLASSRYLVNGRPVALTDIHIPILAVGTMTDHVAPWRSVYKIIPLSDTSVTFLLTSGGHNAGVVSPPGTPNRSYQMSAHEHDAPYVDPDTWQAETRVREGSWWPAWEHWLARLAGPWVAPPPQGRSVRDAPGHYVLEP
ncbi:alpha/beta fold hydrolase [Massilia sp. NEAU-DD11]|uniref:Alpha/beta fold hydrolase n=1 Tax=Massilia cellulosiltytica TaxID=2683234 RepID=A0A7X3FWL2_9BURK|nr:alpha/beta fold hydrolase [Telluria cellulosilytica]MVW59287.1 alpha/beta fold hydrolase [Telluria cellulosilytica]